MNSVLKIGRNVSVSRGKETNVLQRKPDLQELKPSGKKKDDKQSVDTVQFHKDIATRAGHVETSKQMLSKYPANPEEKESVINTTDNDTQITKIRNRKGGVVKENIVNGQVNRSVNIQCKGESVTGSSTRLPRAALASSPGSGNTWTRHLLQQATGIATGSIYGDGQLQQRGFPGETKCVKVDECLIVKTHEWKNDYQTYYDRAILILRHPRESVVSSFHYFNGGLHLKEANLQLFHSDHWIRFAEERIQFWHGLNYDWVTKYHNPLHIIFYEELKAYQIIQIEQAVKFLNFTMTETDKTCMKKNIEGNFQRKHKNVIDLNTLYNDSLSTLMNNRVQNLTAAIQKRYPGKLAVWA
ncbi:WSCD family member CG9164-like [Mizuhopecten yessoensis]|nr:WSCD family member CG9164-like [Mizuhopecten yessoensis]